MVQPLILYTAKICPFAHRVELALAETNAEFTRYAIDLSNKPEWYASKVNPASKVPAIVYGGPQNASPENPSPESTKLSESLILVEFVGDLYPNSGFLPTDPVLRAKGRFFIDTFANKVSPTYMGAIMRGEPFDKLDEALLVLQDLLSDEHTFVLGNTFTFADAAVLPFLARMEVAFANGLGNQVPEDGKQFWKNIQTDEKFSKLKKWLDNMKGRDSFKKTFDAEYIKEVYPKLFASLTSRK